jgi:hypothetical protein
MATTGAPWNLFYPLSTDDVRPYDDIQSLATSVATALSALVANMSAVVNTDATSRTTTSTSFTSTLTPANICGVSFTAPASGKVLITWRLAMANSGAGYTACSPEVRAGSTVGSGAVFLAATDNATISTDFSTYEGQGAALLVTGLTSATVYNVALCHRVVSGTGTFLRREVNVIPQIA